MDVGYFPQVGSEVRTHVHWGPHWILLQSHAAGALWSMPCCTAERCRCYSTTGALTWQTNAAKLI
eukprot:5472744-Amphidinium_carterae.1